jgi:hypothetical protein
MVCNITIGVAVTRLISVFIRYRLIYAIYSALLSIAVHDTEFQCDHFMVGISVRIYSFTIPRIDLPVRGVLV